MYDLELFERLPVRVILRNNSIVSSQCETVPTLRGFIVLDDYAPTAHASEAPQATQTTPTKKMSNVSDVANELEGDESQRPKHWLDWGTRFVGKRRPGRTEGTHS